MNLRLLTALIVTGSLLAVGESRGWGQPLNDPGFEALAGKTVGRAAPAGEWGIPPGPPHADGIDVKPEAAAARSGKTGIRLQRLANGRLAAVQQSLAQLPAGVYEFKVWAKGEGALVLKTGSLRRRGDLGKDWAEYSLTFAQAAAGPADLAIMTDGNAQIDDASLAAAGADRQSAWREQEKARAQFGFLPAYWMAQSPQPGAPARPAGTFQPGPVTWRAKAVFHDPAYDNVHITHPEAVAQYLGANGFQVLAAAPFGDWVKQATRDGAYGTVCVLTHGVCPASVYDDKVKDSPIRKYLEAGGRAVWLGDVPFYYVQDDVHPQIFSKGGTGEILGVRGGWDYGCWANQGEPKVTALGQDWGLAYAGGPAIAAYPEDVTAVLSGYQADYAAANLAVSWFKNFNPLFPWSGFIMAMRAVDLTDPRLQESVYRLALYAGQPVTAPPGIAAPVATGAAVPLKLTLDPPRNRQYFYRGEKVPVRLEAAAGVLPGDGVLRLALVRDGVSFPAGDCPRPAKETAATAELVTADLACGDYRLQVLAIGNGKANVVREVALSLCPRHEDPTFFFGAKGGGTTGNPARQEMAMRDFAAAAMNQCGFTTDVSPHLFDLAIKYGMRFSFRAQGNPALSDAERQEAEERGPNGEKIAGAWEGGRPILGLLHPKRRQLDAEDMAREIKELSAWPNAWLRSETCDDFSVHYGWDYSDLARRLFREKTGLDAPVPPELAKLKEQFKSCGEIVRPKGIVPDNDPWLQWSIFTTKDVAGGYNRVVTAACTKAVPGLKIGPIPGGMQLPIFVPGQYPPHSFGPEGFNLLQYYCYLNYWQPQIADLYWDEAARLNNRDLELWPMPGCIEQNDATYFRNTFFLHLAGGSQGINYFQYAEARPEAWNELTRLGRQVIRPLYPFLGKLRPVQAEHGLLLPYTQFAHTPYYAATALYAYANLLGAHLDVQPTCEEEVLSGYIKSYKTILLWHVEWLRASVAKALEEYIAKGGVVLTDTTTVVPIKGAIRLPVDLAMGDKQSKPDVNDPRLGGPGIKDYLHPDRVRAIGSAIAAYAQPWADCADPTLIVRRQGWKGVTYLWLVNIHSQEEYEFIRPRTPGLSEAYQTANPGKAKTELAQYLAERAGGKRFTARVTIPAGTWAAYDILKGGRVPLEKAGNRLAFTADMERLGGTLIALYPEPVRQVTTMLAADSAKRGSRLLSWLGPGSVRLARGQSATLRVTVSGPGGKPLAGTQPLAVTVRTPQGDWAEVTGAHATEDGVWSTTLRPARNDPQGKWQVRVKELSSGKEGTAAFSVE